MRRICLPALAASLALLCACPVLAAPLVPMECARLRPALYPVASPPGKYGLGTGDIYSADTAQTPPAPYDALWRSFYCAGEEVNWNRLYTIGDYDKQLSYLDRRMAFPVYALCVGGPEDLREAAAEMAAGKPLRELLEPARYGENLVRGFGVRDSATGGYQADWLLEFDPEDGACYFGMYGKYALPGLGGPRYSLALDAPLRRMLSDSGLDLPNTSAVCVTVEQMYCGELFGGILFWDGAREYFLPQDRSGPNEPRGLACGLLVGRLYPMEEAAACWQAYKPIWKEEAF